MNQEQLEIVVDEANQISSQLDLEKPAQHEWQRVDVSQEDQVNEALAGRHFDACVNCAGKAFTRYRASFPIMITSWFWAGINPPGSFVHETETDFVKRIFEINFYGTFFISRAFVRQALTSKEIPKGGFSLVSVVF